MNKSLFFFFLALVVLVGVGCGTQKNTTKTDAPSIVLTKPILLSLTSDGLKDIRFHFEKDFVLTLMKIPGNGVYEVNEDGNLVLLNDTVVKFPEEALGKFINPTKDEIGLKNKTIKVTFDEKEKNDPELNKLGTPVLEFTYEENDSLRMVVSATDADGGKPYVIYQKAKYVLPDDFQTYFSAVGHEVGDEEKVAKGVKTPRQINAAKK